MSTPILEWLEKKIDTLGRDKVFGSSEDRSNLNLDPHLEVELLVYESMMNWMRVGRVCNTCLERDDELWDKYYEEN